MRIKLVNLKQPSLVLTILLLLGLFSHVNAYTGLAVESGGGYSSNLYADSFSLGDSYLYNDISIYNVQFQKTRLKSYYNLSYYNYNDRSIINQFNHLAGLSIFRNQLDERAKWSIDVAGTYRDYTDDESTFDNYNMYLTGNLSYYILPGLQAGGFYQLKQTTYSEYDILNHIQNQVSGQISKTLPSRTTIRGKIDFYNRYFEDSSTSVNWLDFELRVSHNIDIRTGIGGKVLFRTAGSGTRPLSSYYILSGITTYWDPWDGVQANIFTKRILPWGVIGLAKFDYWSRKFNFSESQQSELPWLSGMASRKDTGWELSAKFNRQINIFKKFSQALKVNLRASYLSNDSDDPYYDYDYFQTSLSLTLDIF